MNKIRKYTEIFQKELINFYNDGNSQKKCSIKFKISEITVRELLNANKIKIRTSSETQGITIQKEQEVISTYLDGKSSSKVSNLLKLPVRTVENILKRNNIHFHKEKLFWRNSSLNEDYFNEIDTKDKAYFLGLLMADGYIGNLYTLGISLMEEDRYILEKLRNCINYSLPVKFKKKQKENWKNQYTLSINSKKVVDSVKKYGIIRNKTVHARFPQYISNELTHHFIRGYFDGDGCIYIGKDGSGAISIIGTTLLIEVLQKHLIVNCFLSKTKLNINKRYKIDNIRTVSYGGNKQIKRIYDYLYKDCEDLFLTRKKEKFEKLVIKHK